MNIETGLREALVLSICLLVVGGLVSLFWGRKIVQYTQWITVTLNLFLLISLGVILGKIQEEPGANIWTVGWIFPKDEKGAISLGLLLDVPGVVISALSALAMLMVIFNFKIWCKEERQERIIAGLSLSVVGVTLSWISATPWLGYFALFISIFSGFVSLGTRWDQDPVSETSARFAWERAWGVVLAILGASILAGSRSGLFWGAAESWAGFGGGMDTLGAGVLLFGLFSLHQAFPFMGWNIMTLEAPPLLRMGLNQVFLSWAAFGLLIRAEPLFKQVGLFPVAGWLGLFAAFLSLVSSLLQRQGRIGLNLWVSAGNALAFSALAFSGPLAAMGISFAVGLAGLGFSAAVSAMDVQGEQNETSQKKGLWIRIGCFSSMAVATGVFSTFFLEGWVRFLGDAWENAGLVTGILSLFFVFSIEAWRLAWIGSRVKFVSGATWLSVVSPIVFALAAFIWLWLSGGSAFFKPAPSHEMQPGLPWLLLGINFVGFLISYWTSGRKGDLWKKIGIFAPRTVGFISGGYNLDVVGTKTLQGLRWLGIYAQQLLEEKIWNKWVPEGAFRALRWGSQLFVEADQKVLTLLHAGVRRAVYVPAKFLQLTQCGDVQWYLIFGIGAGIAILLHFMKSWA